MEGELCVIATTTPCATRMTTSVAERCRRGEKAMLIVGDQTGTRAFQAMVSMRDGARLNTFVFLPRRGGPRWPVILHRTP